MTEGEICGAIPVEGGVGQVRWGCPASAGKNPVCLFVGNGVGGASAAEPAGGRSEAAAARSEASEGGSRRRTTARSKPRADARNQPP